MKVLDFPEEQIQNEGQMRLHLGRFTRNFQAQRAKTTAPPAAPKARSYDDIEKEVEEAMDPLADGIRKKTTFPEGAFLHRQRVDSAGERRFRYQGHAIRV